MFVKVLIPIPRDWQCGFRIYLFTPLFILEQLFEFNLTKMDDKELKYEAVKSVGVDNLRINLLVTSLILLLMNFEANDQG